MDGRSIARAALLGNAAFSALCGLVFLAEGGAVASLLLGAEPGVAALTIRIVGAGLVAFAALLAAIALRRNLAVRDILAITASDFQNGST